MITMAQVQADTLHDDVKRLVIADWFADTWLMVAENDRDTSEQLMEKNSDSVSALSDELSEEWETLAAQVGELADENISTTAGLFIREILQGWGSMPFDIIARRVLELKAGR